MKQVTNASACRSPDLEGRRATKSGFAARRLFHGFTTAFLGLFLLVGLLQASAANQPTILTPEEATKRVDKLPKEVAFGFSGVGFYSNRLYAVCNIGLLEIEGGRVRKAYQWRKSNPVVEGPWADVPDDKLWVWRVGDGRFAYYSGDVWNDAALPTYPYLRGDLLTGFRGTSTPRGFLLEGAGNVWRWDVHRQRWSEEMGRAVFIKDGRRGELHRFLMVGDDRFAVVRYGRLFPDYEHGMGDTVHRFASNAWSEVTNRVGKSFFVAQAASTGEHGYLRTRDGDVLQVDVESVVAISTPGFCEALTVSAGGKLMAAFRRLGVYEFNGHWTQLFPLVDSLDGHSWVSLAGVGTEVAVAAAPMSKHGPAAGLWVFDGTKIRRVEFPLAARR
jgi:hypothetical protein